MNILFNVIAPLFLIVALGWALARYKLVPATVSGPLMQYVFYAAVPEVVFTGIVSNHIEKLSVKPGITGLSQVRGRSDLSFSRWVRWDVWYVNNWSFGLDIRILFWTIPIVLKGKGAY